MSNRKTEDAFFINIYQETYNNLRRFVQRRSKDPAMVDDILQEVYIEAFRHIEDLKQHENSIGWIYKTADNKIKKLNSIYIRHAIHETDLEEWGAQVVDNSEEFIEFEQYREVLKEDEYEFLMKKYKDGYSHKDLAKMTGNSVAGSKMKLSRILNKLRKNLRINILFVIGLMIWK